jgi:hypothetical protein
MFDHEAWLAAAQQDIESKFGPEVFKKLGGMMGGSQEQAATDPTNIRDVKYGNVANDEVRAAADKSHFSAAQEASELLHSKHRHGMTHVASRSSSIKHFQEIAKMVVILKKRVMNGESLDVDRFDDFVRVYLKINKSRVDVERMAHTMVDAANKAAREQDGANSGTAKQCDSKGKVLERSNSGMSFFDASSALLRHHHFIRTEGNYLTKKLLPVNQYLAS